MTTKTKGPLAPPPKEATGPAWETPPWTAEERLQRIQALGQRLNGHVEFMGGLGNLNGTSAEAKDKAITLFYERLTALEKQLARILEDLRLG
jgi:hypothetical protein